MHENSADLRLYLCMKEAIGISGAISVAETETEFKEIILAGFSIYPGLLDRLMKPSAEGRVGRANGHLFADYEDAISEFLDSTQLAPMLRMMMRNILLDYKSESPVLLKFIGAKAKIGITKTLALDGSALYKIRLIV